MTKSKHLRRLPLDLPPNEADKIELLATIYRVPRAELLRRIVMFGLTNIETIPTLKQDNVRTHLQNPVSS